MATLKITTGFEVLDEIFKNSNWALSRLVKNLKVGENEIENGIFISGYISGKYVCKHISATTLKQILVSGQIL